MRRYHTMLIPALLLGGQGAAAGQTVLIDKVVAVVNDEVITLSEIHKEGKPLIQRIREELSEDTRARQMQITQRQILDALILRRLQLQEAKKEKVVVEQSEVTATIEQIKKERGLTNAQFTEALARENLTLEELRTRVWEQLTVDRLITRKVRTSIVVSDEEVARYSETQADGFQQTASMRIRHIFIGIPREPSPEDVAGARTRAAEASERLKRGEDFGRVAAEYSDGATAREGGDVGVIRQGDMDPLLERVAFSLKPGSISEIIHTAGGFHIIKVEERMTGDTATAEAREQIRQRLFLEKLKQRMDAYLADLKQKAYIQVRLEP